MLEHKHTATQWDTLWKKQYEALVNNFVRKKCLREEVFAVFQSILLQKFPGKETLKVQM